MDKVFKVYIASMNGGSEASAMLDLPASNWELLDALDKVRYQEGDELYTEISDYTLCEYLSHRLKEDEPDLFTLNALAERIWYMDEAGLATFRGLVEMDAQQKYGGIELRRALDLACSTECCHFVPEVTSDAKLGRFYAENGFMAGLDDLPDNIFELLDFAKIGKEQRTAEGGVFTPEGYVVRHDELKQAPPVPTGRPEKPDYAFSVIANNYPYDLDTHEWLNIPLRFPATEQDFAEVLEKLDAPSWNEVIFTGCEGAVKLPDRWVEAAGVCLDQLNALAETVKQLDERGQLTQYRAAFAATECPDFAAAQALADRLEDLMLDPKVSSPTEMAVSELHFLLSSDDAEFVQPFLNLHEYGKALLEDGNGVITPYGMIQRKDFQPIQTPTQPNQGGMEML